MPNFKIIYKDAKGNERETRVSGVSNEEEAKEQALVAKGRIVKVVTE